MNKKFMAASMIAVSAVALAVSAPASAHNDKQIPDHKVGICHATGSKTNPYVFIVVDKHAADAHAKHQDGRDVIGVTSADKCPKGQTEPGKGGNTSTPKPDSNGQVLGNDTKPTTLPETGAGAAGLSALLGLPAMAVAGRAYLRSRAAK